MAGSLQRPPSKTTPLTCKSSTPIYKSIIKLQKERLLHRKGSDQSSGKKPQQLQHQLLKQLKYCQSLSLGKLLLLLLSLSASLYYDSCWSTASENKKNYLPKLITARVIKYVTKQQQKEQQHHQYQQLQLQKLQTLRQVLMSSKFHKNSLNRKKLPQLQLREIQSFRNQAKLF